MIRSENSNQINSSTYLMNMISCSNISPAEDNSEMNLISEDIFRASNENKMTNSDQIDDSNIHVNDNNNVSTIFSAEFQNKNARLSDEYLSGSVVEASDEVSSHSLQSATEVDVEQELDIGSQEASNHLLQRKNSKQQSNHLRNPASQEEQSVNSTVDEARDNLYWVKLENKESFACMWYGDSHILPVDDIEVMPFISDLHRPSSFFKDYQPTAQQPENSKNLDFPSTRKVKRNQLIPLDSEVVNLNLSSLHPDDAQFLKALEEFAEWEDSFRDSYVWPRFTAQLFLSCSHRIEYFQRISQESLFDSGQQTFRVILFFLAAQQIGIADEFDGQLYKQGKCSPAIQNLLADILDIENKVRSSSRVGDDYQVAIPGLEPKINSDPVNTTEVSKSKTETYWEPPTNLVYSKYLLGPKPERMVKDRLYTYLGRVQLLREKYLHVGQLIEAPKNITSFLQELKNISQEFDMYLTDPFKLHRQQRAIRHMIAGTKQNPKMVTALCTVKYLFHSKVSTAGKVAGAPITQSSSSSGPNAEEEESVVDSVIVYRGTQETKVPIRLCRIFSIPEDQAMELFFTHRFDADTALAELEVMLRSHLQRIAPVTHGTTGCSPPERESEVKGDTLVKKIETGRSLIDLNITLMSSQELQLFISAAIKYQLDIRKVWKKFEKFLREYYQRSEKFRSDMNDPTKDPQPYFFGSGNEVRSLTHTPSPPDESIPSLSELNRHRLLKRFTMKEVLKLYAMLFPGTDDTSLCMVAVKNAGLFPKWYSGGNPNAPAASRPKQQTMRKKPTQTLHKISPNAPGAVLISKRDPSIPNRWPASLPLMRHNLYWVKMGDCPCMCVGLDENSLRTLKEGHLRVLSFGSSTYHHEYSVPATQLEPLDEELLRTCNDERVIGFTLALMDFADWELSWLPGNSPLRTWYVYPMFVMKLLRHLPSFASWRTQAERVARGRRVEKRVIYFEHLKHCSEKETEQEKQERLEDAFFPWDDTALSDDEGEGSGAENDAGSTSKRGKRSAKDEDDQSELQSLGEEEVEGLPGHGEASKQNGRGQESKDKVSKPSSKSSASAYEKVKEVIPVVPVNKVESRYNLFWVPRSNLPAVFYDDEERRTNGKFTVKPICCANYAYPVEVSNSGLLPLTLDNLKECNDDRTHDFTLALLDFAAVHSPTLSQARDSSTEPPTKKRLVGEPGSSSVVDSSEDSGGPKKGGDPKAFFHWPPFILNLIDRPKEWASWRKRVERSSRDATSRRKLYLEALLDEYRFILNSQSPAAPR